LPWLSPAASARDASSAISALGIASGAGEPIANEMTGRSIRARIDMLASMAEPRTASPRRAYGAAGRSER
jgi:hypothetical protein